MLPPLDAEEQLAAMQAATVPHMDKPSRHDVVSFYERKLGSSTPNRERASEAMLVSVGIPVRKVPKKKVTDDG